jgi:DNA-binding NarL/FixJ family response regulator
MDGYRMKALILTGDPHLVKTVTAVAHELEIEAQSSNDAHEAIERLRHAQYQAVLLDFDTIPEAGQLLSGVRESRSNKNAVIFAVATDSEHRKAMLQEGANFLLRRPIEVTGVRRSLYAAYDMMRGEQRRYFRCSSELNVLLTLSSGNNVQGSTMNVSQGGLGVKTPQPLTPGESVYVALSLPDGFVAGGTGLVIWDDEHGKSGLSIQWSGPEMKRGLDAWLDSQFSEMAPAKG